jgi:hypothetical protein
MVLNINDLIAEPNGIMAVSRCHVGDNDRAFAFGD